MALTRSGRAGDDEGLRPEASTSERSPREVLELLREASIMQSADALRHLYAVDAIYEFPFTRPGLPDRLEGRAEIVD